jgi:hypothetical protein
MHESLNKLFLNKNASNYFEFVGVTGSIISVV